MKHPLHGGIMALLFAAAIAPCTHAAQPAAWKPEQNVEIIVGTAAGSGSDVTARLVQKLLQEKKLVERPTIVVNKVGGGGALAASYVTQHPGSGHHLFVTSPTMLTNHILGKSTVNWNDVTPLAQIGTEYVVFSVRADSPIKTGKDLIAKLKQDPAGVSFALANALGNHNHLAVGQIADAAGADTKKLKVVVFQSSSETATALLGGHVDVVSSPGSNVIPHAQAGKVRIIAASSEQRLSGPLANVPTWTEQGVKVVSSNWRSVVGPKGMTDAQVRYWDGVFAKMVEQDEWKKDVEAKNFENTYSNGAETRKLMESQYAELAKTLKSLGLAK